MSTEPADPIELSRLDKEVTRAAARPDAESATVAVNVRTLEWLLSLTHTKAEQASEWREYA